MITRKSAIRGQFKTRRWLHISATINEHAHLAVSKPCPVERQVMQDSVIIGFAELGGPHHRYERIVVLGNLNLSEIIRFAEALS
jgi:hypothetical protein